MVRFFMLKCQIEYFIKPPIQSTPQPNIFGTLALLFLLRNQTPEIN